jgi:fibronectin-binding autotransporter adhesin
VGYSGSSNKLTIADGGKVISGSGYIGYGAISSNNAVTVTGPGSVWSNSSSLDVGYYGSSNNQLAVASGGAVVATNIVIGSSASTLNRITVSGGSLDATNGAGTGALNVRYGALALNSGTVIADRLIATNATSVLDFDGGTLTANNMNVSNGSVFAIGNGVDAATLNLRGTGHRFGNGLSISSNATLAGIGSFTGAVTFLDGAHLAPGFSAGTLTNYGDVLFSSVSLLDYELGPPGIVGGGTNDLFVINGNLTLDGILNVTGLSGFDTGTYTLITYSGSLVNNGLAVGSLPQGYDGFIQAGSGQVKLVVLPEPSTGALLCAGIGAWLSRRRRKR